MGTFVIVIDDSPTTRKILETCLHRAGYEVKSFQDGIETLRWFSTPEGCIPALILVDVGLPKMDGYEVIRRLKAKAALRQTAFVILSGNNHIIDRIKGYLAGAQVYLTKPFKTAELLAVVQAQLDDMRLRHDHTAEQRYAATFGYGASALSDR